MNLIDHQGPHSVQMIMMGSLVKVLMPEGIQPWLNQTQ
jgi:hypothetical protein